MSTPSLAMARLELSDALRSRWVVFVAAVYLFIFGMFVWLGLRESTVLGFTGLSRVVLNLSNAVVVVVPFVALVATNQTIVRGRTTGFFEMFLTQPMRRRDWLMGVTGSRLAVIVGPLLVLLLATLLVGSARRDAALPSIVGRTLLVMLALSWAFVGLGLLISSIARTSERATVYALVAWFVTVALHDFALIGVLLKTRLPAETVFALAAVNPVESARLAILSGVDPDLAVLGPVGFWLANTLGPNLTLLLGVAWPFVIGTVAILSARRRLDHMDLVG